MKLRFNPDSCAAVGTHAASYCGEGDQAGADTGDTGDTGDQSGGDTGDTGGDDTGGGLDLTAKLGTLISSLETMSERLSALESDAGDTGDTGDQNKPKPDKALTKAQRDAQAARQAQQQSLKIAKRALVKAELGGLKSPAYLKLAPDVQLTDDGELTDDSKKALAKFRKDHQDLFGAGPRGRSPMPGAGGGETTYTPEQTRAFANAGISPGSWRKAYKDNPALLASVDSYRQSN